MCDIVDSDRNGEIDKRPKLWCAQPLLCSPIATAILGLVVTEELLRSHSRGDP